MKKLMALTLILISSPLSSFNDSFCVGFQQGYMAFKGNNVAIPACPAPPIPSPINTNFQLGIKAGVFTALKK